MPSRERPTSPVERASLASSRRRRAWWPFGLAMATTVVVCAGMWGIWRWSGKPGMDVATAEMPPSSRTHFLAHDRGGHIDHHVLYYGLDGRAHERLTAADVLFLGNSRLMFALDDRKLRTTFELLDLRYYVLGFGHDEGHGFPRALIDRFDLRPAVVVVNVDNFFSVDRSPWAVRVLEDGWFDAVKLRFEAAAAHVVRRYLHQVVPHWPDVLADKTEFVIHRSAIDGTWDVGTKFRGTGPLPLAREPESVRVEPSDITNARAFKSELARRGSRLVLCLVPSPDTPRARAFALGEALGVPVVAPAPDNPQTIDGSHLSEQSAEAFSDALLDELAPIVQREAALVRAGR